MHRPGLDSGDGVRHRTAGVVVGVDAHFGLRETSLGQGLARLGDAPSNAVGQRATVGVAQSNRVGTGAHGLDQDRQTVFGVIVHSIEVVFRIQDDATPLLHQESHRVADHGEVLCWGGLQGLFYVAQIGFRHQGDDLGLGIAQTQDLGVFLYFYPGFAGRAESRQLGVLQLQFAGQLKELGVFRDGAGPAPLNHPHPQLVQSRGDAEFIRHGQGDAFHLGPVTQSRVVDLYRSLGQGRGTGVGR